MHFPDIGSFFKGRVKLVKLLDIRVVTIGFLRPYRLFSGIFLCGTILKAAPNKKKPPPSLQGLRMLLQYLKRHFIQLKYPVYALY
jgi:hypothetical protein